jgi:cellulose synthase/poly-beta-1,6-N-acetylglucosamine synthase-like glycosyltransferase
LRPPRLDDEYAFLVGALVDPATLQDAEAEALDCGAATHEVLLARSLVSEPEYAAALAHRLGLPILSWDADLDLSGPVPRPAGEVGLAARIGGRPCRLLSATEAAPDVLLRHVGALLAQGIDVALAPQMRIDAAIEAHVRSERMDRAVRGLLRERPAISAGAPFATWQAIAGVVVAGLLIGGFAVLPDATIATLTALIALPFLCVTALRLVALRQAFASRRKVFTPPPRSSRVPDRLLPVYSVLVPLFREANVLPGLVQSLQALDYPPAKLEIFLILEADDTATQAAVLSQALPGNFRSLIVPSQGPRTKPKALNYALQFARGDFVVVYDAEDRPQPGQLRRAWDVFRQAPPGLACLQAQLNIYNPGRSWFTRQFTIEYSALFDAILPALEKLGLPVPLGGTSNHFPRSLLIGLGAWDPYNVTEDADLGIRIARQGYHTGVLASTTWEEAPPAFGVWLKQRTRWLKGWMQTYLVHTRELRRLNRELGLGAAIGFHALMGGLIASALVHPLFYVLLGYYWLSDSLLEPAESAAGAVLWVVGAINLAVGYVVSILVGVVSVLRRRRPGLALHALLMPLYWLLISAAAYRAAWQLARNPYLWEKTEHGADGA